MLLASLLTPFDRQGKVDLGRLRAHVLWMTAAGVEGFIPTSTAGEFLYLNARERQAVHRTVLDSAKFATVIPCVWDPNPTTTVTLAEAARSEGAAAVIVPPPLYYDLDQSVVSDWYKGLAHRIQIPVYAMHSPRHIATTISDPLYRSLRAEGVLAGIEDASEDPFRIKRLVASDPGAIFASGDRVLLQASRLAGIGGVISTLVNAWPTLVTRVHNGETQLADALLERITSVRRAGGLRALKGVLDMGCRWPLPPVDRSLLSGLPPKEELR
ncbi:MAG: dihydrodipicolinate synthase family protein [Proteobacteria bacterium]|nr:dihydrodipicolinate synthase family protein [Pseudomonadota bacterium]